MSITIQEINDRVQWNDFLTSQPGGHLLQSYEWGELHTYLGGRTYRLGALDGDRLLGTMQFITAAVPLPGLHLTWLYSARGPTISTPDSLVLSQLIEHAHRIAHQERAVVLRLEPNIADDDPAQNRWLALYHKIGFHSNPHAIHARRSWVLDIRPSPEALLAQFKMTWRQNIRIAERKGVIIRPATTEADFDAYYDLLKLTSERDAFFIHDKAHHKEILRRFSANGNAALFLAEHEGEPLAAKMLLRFGTWCWDMFGASSNHKRNLKPTYLLQYHCIRWAQSCGCHYFDFRAIPEVLEPGEEMWGVYEYKKGFGGFSRLNMPTQDYIYRPYIYSLWNTIVELRRKQRHQQRKKVELERAERGKIRS